MNYTYSLKTEQSDDSKSQTDKVVDRDGIVYVVRVIYYEKPNNFRPLVLHFTRFISFCTRTQDLHYG